MGTPSRSENFNVTLKSDHTVAQAKDVISMSCDTPASRQRLIFAGRVLKDTQILSDCKIVDGVTVHMVPMPAGTNTSQPRTASSTQPSSQPQSNPPPQAQPSQPQGGSGFNFGSLFGSAGQGGNMFQQMNERLMNDPELLRSVIDNNPQMRQIMEQNPQVAQLLRDPATLRQAMQSSQNPELMREMMRSTDRQMSQIENMPGGFNMLRQQFENVVEPMHQATQMPAPQDNTTDTSSEPPSATPNNAPLPNPWAPNQGTGSSNTGSNTGSNSGTSSNTQQNPFFGMFGSNLFGGQNPFAQNLFGQLNQDNQGNGAGLFGMTPEQMQNAMQMASQMFSSGNGNGPNPNMFANMGSLFGQQPGVNTTPSSSSQQMSPEARFAVQLQQLNDMGFNDQEAN